MALQATRDFVTRPRDNYGIEPTWKANPAAPLRPDILTTTVGAVLSNRTGRKKPCVQTKGYLNRHSER